MTMKNVIKYILIALVAIFYLNYYILSPFVNKSDGESILNNLVNPKPEISIKSILTEKQFQFLRLIIADDFLHYAKYKNSDSLASSLDYIDDLVVKLDKLYHDYYKNEIMADDIYKDKKLITTGRIESINRGLGKQYYLTLSTSDELHVVSAHFDEKYKNILSQLRKDNIYTMHCVGGGMVLNQPTLYHCKPIEEWTLNESDNLLINFPELIKTMLNDISNEKNANVIFEVVGSMAFVKSLQENNPLLDCNFLDTKCKKLFEVEVEKFQKNKDSINHLKEVAEKLELDFFTSKTPQENTSSKP